METRNVLAVIFSILFVIAFGFVLSWGIINFNKVKDGMSGTGVYTKEDMNKSYEDGYNTALTDKEEYTNLINSYRDTITTLNDNISQLNSQITVLQKNNKDYKTQVDKLTTQKTELQTQVDNLTTIKTNNEQTIASLSDQVAELQNRVTNLTKSDGDKSEQISILNGQITNLQNTISQLQTTNEINLQTITSLNSQITSLNNQISEMTLLSQNSASQISALNSKIAELEKSIAYYEQYISQLENGEQVVATFEFDGSVYNIQIVNKGSKVSVVNPTSTAYKIFNGWKVDNETVDLDTYTITVNTKFVADVTYKFDVKFMDGETVVKSDIIVKDGFAALPTSPTKDGYEFDGWSTNGVDIVDNIETTPVTANTTYKAVWTKLHTVTFMYENETKSTQTIRNGSYATVPTIENTTYKVFNGWKYNNVVVNVASYPITQDITFVADITYKYDVKFMVDNSVYSSQIVEKNGYATAPTVNSSVYKTFNGWKVNDVIVNVSQYKITQATTFYADFTISTVSLTAQNFLNYIYTVGQKNITSIVFDYFENENKYVVNGTNVLNGLTGTSLDSDNKIMLYRNGTLLYVLSNYVMRIDSGTRLFADMRNLTSLSLCNFDTSNMTDMSSMFSGCSALTSLDLSNFDTSKVTNMSKMFENCISLTSLNISSFNTSKVTNMSSMFYNCNRLTSLNISSFNTSKVTNMSYMFYECKNLPSINVSSFNTSNVLYMMGMFSGCSKLTVLDLSNFNTTLVKRFDIMFEYCSMLTTIYANEKFTTVSVEVDTSSYIDGRKDMFYKCENLVGAISYNSSKVDCSYANYTTGYFTYKAKA